MADLRVVFDRRLKLEFHGSKVTSDAGLLAFRELDDALGLSEMAGQVLADSRTGRNNRHTLTAQFRQSLFGRLAGDEDVNDADRLGHDPAMRWIVGGRAVTREAASTSQMGRFETEVLTGKANLADLSGKWIDAVHIRRPTNVVVLDMDSSVSPTYGDQEGIVYNGHFGCTCYHPLFVLYDYLEAERYKYTIRLKANTVLQGHIAHLLERPVGRAPKYVQRFYASFSYQAGSWSRKRRVVAKVEWHPGELYPRVGFIVTNLTRPAARVTAFYSQRGTAEQYIKEGKNAVKWTRLSCRTMKANAVRLQLHALPTTCPTSCAPWPCPTRWKAGR